MPMNAAYHQPGDLAAVIPVFPLPGALLLPRGQMPLNIFEPRYLAMVDDSFRDGHRLIGMIQPDVAHSDSEERPTLFKVGCVGPPARARTMSTARACCGRCPIFSRPTISRPIGRASKTRPTRRWSMRSQ